MEIVPVAALQDRDQIKRVAALVRAGAVLAYPTDTLYGLGGMFWLAAVHDTIDRLKGRAHEPYSVAVCDRAMLGSLVSSLPADFDRVWQMRLPGPYTLIMLAAPHIGAGLLKKSATIGLRIPAAPVLLRLIQALDAPLVTTSVNRSGEPALNDPQAIAVAFPEIDLLIDGGILPPSRGSTVIDLTVVPYAVRRQGDGPLPL
jgi:L-threonylcarbamoyladenylate synthase